MHDIDHAFATGVLTPPQASTLLADIAVHGNMAAQVAAGAEFAAIASAAGTGIQSIPGSANFALYQEVLGVIGVAMGGTVYGTMPTTYRRSTPKAHRLPPGRDRSQGNSDANRQRSRRELNRCGSPGSRAARFISPSGKSRRRISRVPTLDAMRPRTWCRRRLIRTAVLGELLLPANICRI